MTTVVNCRSGASYDVYFGRAKGGTVPKTGRGKWGNPFEVGEDKDGTLEECLEKFERYILEGGVEKYDGTIWDGRHLLEHLPEIRGKVLGCFCAPEGHALTAEDPPCCHAQIAARLAYELADNTGITPEQAARIRKRVHEGMSEKIAREEVLGKGWVEP